MKLVGNYKMNASPSELWKALNDPEVLRSCTPGCKQIIAKGDDSFDVVIEIGVASVKGRYTGHIATRDRIPDRQYRLDISGNGSAGFLRANGLIQLSEQGEGTLVEYTGEAHVGGLAAGLGQRVMEGVAKLLVGQFFSSLQAIVQAPRHT
jgi:carbon monoxide dehydrogenase subunit G